MRVALVIALSCLGTFASNAAPPATYSVNAAYDEKRGRLVVFGGFFLSDVFDDTWEWDGTTWRQVATSGPSPRFASGMVYDAQRERVILFGGSRGGGAGGELGDTWEWNGTQWTQVATTGPSARITPSMVYDRARGRIVLFGGLAAANTRLNDTWEWNGTSWERVLAAGPATRGLSGMAYDEKRGVTVLFGGDHDGTANGLLRDTWLFDGRTWTEVTSADGPSARDHVAMAYDPVLERIVLFGGGDSEEAGAWQWNGAQWQTFTATGPEWRDFPRMVTDRAGTRVLMYGGSVGPPSNELWILSCDRWSQAPP
jgi:hypothetical protein